MNQQRYPPFQILVHKIASSRLGVWLSSGTLHHVDRFFFRVTGGRATLSSLLSGAPVVMLTTIGAKSGLPRTVPLMCIQDRQDAEVFALIASNWGQAHYPAWYHNLKADPRATCSIGGRTGAYIAHEASGDEYARFWQYAEHTYQGFPIYKQHAAHRRIPIMVMKPFRG